MFFLFFLLLHLALPSRTPLLPTEISHGSFQALELDLTIPQSRLSLETPTTSLSMLSVTSLQFTTRKETCVRIFFFFFFFFFLNFSPEQTNPSDRYNTGVTNNGIAQGNLIFTPVSGAPRTLYYICEVHPAQTGQFQVSLASHVVVGLFSLLAVVALVF